MQSSTRTLQNSIIPSPNMFHRLSSTLPVLLVFLSTLVASSLQEPLCCDAVFQDADGTKTLVFLNAGLCFLVYCIAYHGNSAIRCSPPGIDCPFSFQVFADCDLVVCSFSLIRQYFFLTNSDMLTACYGYRSPLQVGLVMRASSKFL